MSINVRDTLGSKGVDWMTLSLYLSLVGIGWLMIYTVGYRQGYTSDLSDFLMKTTVGKQTIFILLGFVLIFIIMIADWKIWRTFSYVVYAFSLVLLLLVLVFGSNINGARSWFNLGFFSIQPSEIAKFGTCLALSSYLGSYSVNLRDARQQIIAMGHFLLPIAIIMLQPDAGSALVFLSFFIMLYREGMSPTPFIIGSILTALFILALSYEAVAVILGLMLITSGNMLFNIRMNAMYRLLGFALWCVLSVWAYNSGFATATLLTNLAASIGLLLFGWFRGKYRIVLIMLAGLLLCSAFTFSTNYSFNHILKPHQQERINVWLHPEKCDPKGAAYNLIHSKMAIGSGGLEGKGFLEGTMTKLNYVPEQSTDFIFCTIGEEQGFVGTFAIVGLYILLLIRITILAERQRSNFSRHYAYGVAGILFVHFFINIGMTMGMLPIIGIPLPFISAGGSSLLGFTLLIAVLLKMDSHRYSV